MGFPERYGIGREIFHIQENIVGFIVVILQ
jgi:hypothetical protein